MDLGTVKNFLAAYDGPDMNIMEVCGSHTGAIAKSGIPGLLSPKIHLLSGPGCPVCVTPSSYIDRLIELATTPGTCVCTFGDLLRVPGSAESLSDARGRGGRVEMLYSPFDVLNLAESEPETRFVFAAIGFETTAPVYALLADRIEKSGQKNVTLLTSIRTMPPVIDALLSGGANVDGFIAPGHVSVIIGAEAFRPLAEKYGLPFGVAGFDPANILTAIAGIVKARGKGIVMNFYPSVVTTEGNGEARAEIAKVFEPADAVWRGLGPIPASGLCLRQEYGGLDAGSRDLSEDRAKNSACRCGDVLSGRIRPTMCPLYGKVCTPLTPQGACMVSEEGNCRTWYAAKREK